MRAAQQGMAIIMALLIVALAATAAAAVLWQQNLWWRQTDNDRARSEVRQLADAGLGWAGDLLAHDAAISRIDHPGEIWAQPLPDSDIGGMHVSGRLSDAQGRFNLRNLLLPDGRVDDKALLLYLRLLQVLQLSPALANTLADWLDSDDIPRPLGAESAWYAAQTPPYTIPPAQTLRRSSQLRWVKGYDPVVMQRLAPYVVVLPQRTDLNVNTLSPVLLQALVPGLGAAQAQLLAARRGNDYFLDAADFRKRLPAGLAPLDVGMGVSSDFFLLHSDIRHPRTQLRLTALLQRTEQQSSVLWREEGVIPALPVANGES